MSRAVVLVSGGIDSALCLALAAEEHDEVVPVHFGYGQQTGDLEAHMAQNQVADRRVKSGTDIAPIQWVSYRGVFRHFAQGVAGDREEFTTEDGDLVEDDGRSTGYVPMRNLLLIAAGAGIADDWDADAVYHGAQSGDEEAYPDCRPQFMAAAQGAINYSLADGDYIAVETPLIRLSKSRVIKNADNYDVAFEWTYSCYEQEDDLIDPEPCGECPACIERSEAFAGAGVEDPHSDEDEGLGELFG